VTQPQKNVEPLIAWIVCDANAKHSELLVAWIVCDANAKNVADSALSSATRSAWTRDRSYKTPFQPKTIWIHFLPQILDDCFN
jgi:hypothetical protein